MPQSISSSSVRLPSPEQIKKIPEAQMEVTQMLKAMGTIKKIVEKNKKIDLLSQNLRQLIKDAVLSNSTVVNNKLKQYISTNPFVTKLIEQELVAACIFNDIPKSKDYSFNRHKSRYCDE